MHNQGTAAYYATEVGYEMLELVLSSNPDLELDSIELLLIAINREYVRSVDLLLRREDIASLLTNEVARERVLGTMKKCKHSGIRELIEVALER